MTLRLLAEAVEGCSQGSRTLAGGSADPCECGEGRKLLGGLFSRLLAGGSESSGCSTDDENLFLKGADLAYEEFTWHLVTICAAMLVATMLLNMLEYRLEEEDDPFYAGLLEKIISELSTFGLVAFILFLLEQTETIQHNEAFFTFEFAHVLIFFMAFFFVLNAITLVLAWLPVKRSWDKTSYMTLEEVLPMCESNAEHNRWVKPPLLATLLPGSWRTIWKDLAARSAMEYHLARCLFIETYNQPPDFDFEKYCIRMTNSLILHLVDVPVRAWMALLFLNWFALGFKVLTEGEVKDSRVFTLWGGFVLNCGLWACAYLLVILLQKEINAIVTSLGAEHPLNDFGQVLQGVWVDPRLFVAGTDGLAPCRGGRQGSIGSVSVGSLPSIDEAQVSPAPSGAGLPRDFTNNESKAAESPVSDSMRSKGGASAGDAQAQKIISDTSSDVSRRSSRDSVSSTRLGRVADDIRQSVMTISKHSTAYFKRDNLFRSCVEVLMLCQNFQLAFWAIYFVDYSFEELGTYFWCFLIPLPIFFSVATCYSRLVPCLALLNTMKQLSHADIAEVERETREAENLRRRVIAKLQIALEEDLKEFGHLAHGESVDGVSPHIRSFFARFDRNGDGVISPRELRQGLARLGLEITDKQNRELIRVADPNRTGNVNLCQFSLLLHDLEVAMSAEGSAQDEMDVMKRLLIHPDTQTTNGERKRGLCEILAEERLRCFSDSKVVDNPARRHPWRTLNEGEDEEDEGEDEEGG
ncbi:unnamed protein product [Chrysoparadoxa australica]